jgi:hypothetical protein
MLGDRSGAGSAGAGPNFCGRCGREFAAVDLFCSQCGAARRLDAVGPTPTAPESGAALASSSAPLAVGQRGRHIRRVLDAAVIVAIVVVGVLVAFPGVSAWWSQATTPSCTVGLTGASVSVTVQGSTAEKQCEAMLAQTTNGGTWYRYASGQQPAGASICQVHYEGDLWIVRDEGALELYSSSICSNLVKLANGQPLVTAPPTPQGQVYAACGLRLDGSNATVIADASVCSDLRSALPSVGGGIWDDYYQASLPSGDDLICEGVWSDADVQVWDSGFAIYGSEVCDGLGWSTP